MDERDEIFLAVLDALGNERSMKALAERAGVSTGTLYNWLREGGTRRPQINTLRAVAEAVGYELVLLRRKGNVTTVYRAGKWRKAA